MPQLDQFAYVSQVIWLTLSLSVLYFIFTGSVLPRIYQSLRNRGFIFMSFKSILVRTEKELFFLDSVFVLKSSECFKLLSKVGDSVLPLILSKLQLDRELLVSSLTEDKDSILALLEDQDILGDLNYCYVIDSDSNLSVEEKQNWKREFFKR